ncbi:protein virilizer isoform X2 [Neocloeon triangulifer]|uniref:protein virilizer isoform X2 n=1 Tax=Neocloeon triangulifer TaxID=2078957 RepID=UPI00286F76A9|nr:protein virilizer isoform X2 [Neocloeon triangulifer]
MLLTYLIQEESVVATPFEALSPGDVESISSDGDIGDNFEDDLGNGNEANSPANEPNPENSPLSTPDQDPEQYEPILSDEDMEDAEFQDYEFEDIKDITIEKTPEFDPAKPIDRLQNLVDPSLSIGENIMKNPKLACSGDASKFIELLESWQSEEISESWVEMLEQLIPLVSTSLYSKPSCVPKLIEWVEIGLNVNRAKEQTQPAFKVRHLKAGLRLAFSLCTGGFNTLPSLIEAGLFRMVTNLIKEEYMALSLKLLALSVLDAALSNNQAMESFIQFRPDVDHEQNGVGFLLEQWQNSKVTRVKFALNNLIRKINYYETLIFVHQKCSHLANSDLENEEKDQLASALKSVDEIYIDMKLKIGQFKRFLPVGAHFGFPQSTFESHTAAYSMMKSAKLLECLLICLTNLQLEESVNVQVFELIDHFLSEEHGLRFLASQLETTQALIKTLTVLNQPLGLKMAYSMRIISILDELSNANLEEITSEDDIESFKALQILCETPVGRLNVAKVLSMSNYSDPLFKIAKSTPLLSAARNLSLDLIHSTVSMVDCPEYLFKYGNQLRQIFTEENKLAHLAFWVKHYDCSNIQTLCQELSANIEKAKSNPEELIPIMRVLKYLALPDLDQTLVEFENANKRQLLLELFSQDGLSTLSNILAAVASAFEHPELHAATLSGIKGLNVVNLVLPCMSLLRAILTLVASSQGAEFKNLTPVGPLLSIYELLHAYRPDNPFYQSVNESLQLTVKSLMAYTQPCSEEQLPKSTWTQMVAEVFKHISLRPNTVLPGLDLLSKLLPRPLPVCGTRLIRSEDEKRIISFYRLWGAHLHPLASAIHEIISLFSVSSVRKLASKLFEICGLMSDLGPSLALIVVQSVVEGLVGSIKIDRKLDYNSETTKSRLCLLTGLSARGAPKIAMLHLLRNGGSEENGLITLLTWVLNKNIEDKRYIELELILKFLDNLFQPKELVFSSEWIALPSREIIQSVSSCLLDLIITLAQEQKSSHAKDILSALSILHLISGSDVGRHWFKVCLEGKSEPFAAVFNFCSCIDEKKENLISRTIELLKKCYPHFESSATFLSKIVGCDAENKEKHPLCQLSELNTDIEELYKLVSEVQHSDIPLEKVLDSDTPPTPVAEQLPAQFLLQEPTRESKPPTVFDLPSLPETKEHLKNLDLAEIVAATLPDINLAQEIEKLNNMHRGDDIRLSQSDVSLSRERAVRKPMSAPIRGRLLFPRSVPSSRGDTFRSRPPNTSRPPSLHVDDFLALESAGQQPTGPTGYNKQTMRAAKEMLVTRPQMRGRPMAPERRGRFMATPAPTYRR